MVGLGGPACPGTTLFEAAESRAADSDAAERPRLSLNHVEYPAKDQVASAAKIQKAPATDTLERSPWACRAR